MKLPKIIALNLTFVASIIPALAQNQFDAVAHGKEVFTSKGCVECHSIQKNDKSMKTGPNLYGLFLKTPRDRAIGPTENRKNVKADKAYFIKSVRQSWDELAVAETGPTKGTTYMRIMPQYTEDMISNKDLESLWHYLRTLTDKDQAGPTKVMLNKAKKIVHKNLINIPGEIPVTTRPRVFRAPISGTSGRSLHIGLPNGMNYTFDARMLSVRQIWNGGFLNLRQERGGRGTRPSTIGHKATIILDKDPILAPITPNGKTVDFEFKEPDVLDYPVIEKHLWDKTDFDTKFANIDAEFLGHNLNTKTHQPTFLFRIGKNKLEQQVKISNNGELEIIITGKIIEEQQFQLRSSGLENPSVNGGTLTNGKWKLPVSETVKTYHFNAKIPTAKTTLNSSTAKENWQPQPLISSPTIVLQPDLKRKRRKGKPLLTQAGYSTYSWKSPLDIYGRKQLFAAMGIAVAKDGTIVLATRASGIWRIRDKKWTLFAEGTFEALGVVIEDDKGDKIVIAQKPELTRITDTNGDGRADSFQTICDDFGFHGNYHEYTHGPVRDKDGNYYFNLNLAHDDKKPRASWRGAGRYMGTMGGYRGWSCRVTPQGKFEPFANGLRSPAGMGFAPDGRLWYSENQGEYVGSSKWVPLEQGKFYGHTSGLVDLPGVTPEKGVDEIAWAKKLRKGAVWLPHNKIANSPGNPAWDTTNGKFGPYSGQTFMGDQTLSQLFRVVTEKVNGIDQGGVIPFAEGLSSGVMRPYFLPDGSMLIGQTGRGWYATGGFKDGLQHMVWDGKTTPGDILKITSSSKGFDLTLTAPLSEKITAEQLKKSTIVKSWFYTNKSDYGSPELDVRNDALTTIQISADRKTLHLQLTNFGKGDKWLDRIYHIHIPDTKDALKNVSSWETLQAYFTLRAIPK